jgi:hypothetical protein
VLFSVCLNVFSQLGLHVFSVVLLHVCEHITFFLFFFLHTINKSRRSKKDRQYNGLRKKDRQYNGLRKKDRQYNGLRKKDRQYNGLREKDKRTNNNLHRKLKIEQYELP